MAAVMLIGCGAGSEATQTVAARPQATKAPREETTVPEIFRNRGPLKCPSHSEHISVTLDADPSAENVGIFMAEVRGYFADAGLDVFAGGPKNPARAVKYVTTGIDAIGVAQLPQVVLAREEGGAPTVAIGSVMPRSNAAMIWLRGSGISGISDLAGKAIAVPGVPFQEDFLEQVLASAGLTLEDVVVKRANYKSAVALLEGRVDAIFGGTRNIEGAALEAEGAEPVITPLQELGIPGYEELVVIAPAKCLSKHPRVFRDFLAAVARGTNAALRHPGEVAKLLAQDYELDPKFHIKDLRAQLAATYPLLSRDPRMDPARAQHLIAWMHEKGMIAGEPPAGEMFTNDFLAKP